MIILFEDRRKKLITTCKSVVEMKKYKRKNRKTYCNLAALEIAKTMDAITSVLFFMKTRTSGIIPGTANIICNNATKMAEKGELEILTPEEAQDYAWAGFPVLACWKNPIRFRSGHVAIVYPTDPNQDPLEVCNIGWENLICEPSDKRAFGDRKIIYYRLPIIL